MWWERVIEDGGVSDWGDGGDEDGMGLAGCGYENGV